MMRATRRHRPPETLAQAAEWERTKARYLGLGLCHKCAAQAAYGHQQHAGGWSVINPPCSTCAAIVAQLPMETTNPAWRKSARHPRSPNGAPPRSTTQLGAKNGAVVGAWGNAEIDQFACEALNDVGQVATDYTGSHVAVHAEEVTPS
jgi:hypothetical protein